MARLEGSEGEYNLVWNYQRINKMYSQLSWREIFDMHIVSVLSQEAHSCSVHVEDQSAGKTNQPKAIKKQQGCNQSGRWMFQSLGKLLHSNL